MKHDIYWDVQPSSVLQGHGCVKCKSDKISNKLSKTHEQYINELKNINPNIKVIEKYIGANTPILHKCLIDGYEWYVKPSNILSGYGCPKCNESKGEKIICEWLNKHNIKYDSQKRFVNCSDKNPLPFDFYLPEYNCCIEYQGKQHYESIKYFGGQEQFEYIQKHDVIKNEYCKNNGIPLLRIPYYKFDNIEEELNNFLFI